MIVSWRTAQAVSSFPRTGTVAAGAGEQPGGEPVRNQALPIPVRFACRSSPFGGAIGATRMDTRA
jgi:hypothetical protein